MRLGFGRGYMRRLRGHSLLSTAHNEKYSVYLLNRVRDSQGYPETLFRNEADQHGADHLVDMAIGIALLNRTELQLADGTKRAFLTTPHFYSDLADEFR